MHAMHSANIPRSVGYRRAADATRDWVSNHQPKLEGAGHPATPSGPPLTNTLQAPSRNPFTGTGSAGIPLVRLA
jgi:hypothetical protein